MFAVTPIAAKDGNAASIAGGVDFIDTSGTGAGPWIIGKAIIDPAGVNVQYVLANNAAKIDLSSVAGTGTATGHGTAAGALRVELPTDGTGTVTANAGTNLNTSALALDTSVNGVLVAQGSATSGQKGPLNLAAVTTNAPSYVTAQSSPLSLDTSGLLRVSIKDTPQNTTAFKVDGSAVTQPVSQSGAPWSENITQFGGTNISTGTGAGGTGIPRVTVSNDSNILATQSGNWTARIVGNAGGVVDFAGQNAAAPANAVLTGAEFNTTPTTISPGNVSPLQCDAKGNLHVTLFQQGTATPSPTGNGTSTGSIRVTLGNDSTGIVSPAASSGSGATVKTVEAAASTNATSVKASAGTVWNFNMGNSAAYDVYFKFYNKASSPTVGTDAVFYKIKVPSGGRADMTFPVGIAFTTGIAYAITKLEADSDTTVVVAGDINGGFGWQ